MIKDLPSPSYYAFLLNLADRAHIFVENNYLIKETEIDVRFFFGRKTSLSNHWRSKTNNQLHSVYWHFLITHMIRLLILTIYGIAYTLILSVSSIFYLQNIAYVRVSIRQDIFYLFLFIKWRRSCLCGAVRRAAVAWNRHGSALGYAFLFIAREIEPFYPLLRVGRDLNYVQIDALPLYAHEYVLVYWLKCRKNRTKESVRRKRVSKQIDQAFNSLVVINFLHLSIMVYFQVEQHFCRQTSRNIKYLSKEWIKIII